ncbi:F0F1 ATP synthase subunit epsilon [Gemmobacter serpentinus]|uniref:F0F1 ATP synthase subunit epsilon n=1 Tax=Gemmobacter serpentinus TaxID=2652247 RepID=UPI00124DF82E|nr:F0F1 ATP synthase subunit epsilon [Gemmobacter serpentinus]
MANTLQFDLVSPERKLASVQATEVQIPGAEGDMTAMAGHVATITTLRPGILKAIGPQGTQAFAVTGGFAEIGASSVTVLAERAIPVDDLSGTVLDDLVKEARELLAIAPEDQKAHAEMVLSDVLALRSHAKH